MHKWAKQILECVKARVDSIGLDSFEGQALDDLKDWTEIAKNIAKLDKDYRIVEAMEKSEDNEEIMRRIERYEDAPDRRFYDHYRYADGRFAPKGRGTRRGYEEPPYYFQTPEMYHHWNERSDAERNRDLDRMGGRMYYTEPIMSSYDRAKRHYTESKQLHRANAPADKEQKIKDLELYMKELSGDVTALLEDMTPEERTLLKTKMSTLLQKI